MKLEDVTRLLEAGFTAAEIRGMVETEVNEDPELESDPDPAGELDPEPDEEKDTGPAMNPETVRLFKSLEQSINNLSQMIKAHNIRSNEIEDTDSRSMDDQVNDALSEIINPTFKESKERKGKK